MDIQKGSRVLVNVAPFIASSHRGKDAIPCRVLSVEESAVEVATEFPYREHSMWVSSTWIERLLDADFSGSSNDDEASERNFNSGASRNRSSLQPA